MKNRNANNYGNKEREREKQPSSPSTKLNSNERKEGRWGGEEERTPERSKLARSE